MGMAVLMAMCSSMLEKNTRGGLLVVGFLNLGGSLDLIYNAVNMAELSVEKGANTLLVPPNAHKQLNDFSDDMITKIDIKYYNDLTDCLVKCIQDGY